MKQWLSEFFGNAAVVSKVLLVVAIPTSLLLFHVWNQYRITEMGYELAEVTSEHRDLMEENKKLSVEARLQGRSDRVSEVARNQFGLEAMRPGQIITVESDVSEKAEEHAVLDDAESATAQSAMQ